MADLIVPKSPIQGGAAAQVRVEASSVGAAVSDFGATVFGNAMKIRDEQDARALSQARLDMQRGMSDLRLEFEQVSDPSIINNNFQPRVADMRQNIVGGLTERLQSRAGQAFDELSQRHAAALGARAVNLHQDQMLANLSTQRSLAIEAGANADEGLRETNAMQYADGIEEALNSGAITHQQAVEMMATYTRDADTTAATNLLNTDPAALAAALRAGEFAGIVGNQRPTLLARADAAAATLANRAETAANKLAATQLDNVIDAANQGRIFENETDILDTPEFRDHPKFNEALAAVNLRDDRPEIAQMTPDQLRAAIAEERGKTVANGYDNDRLKAMEAILASSEAGWKNDPVAQAESVGLMPPTAPEDIANADEQTLVNFFAARADFANEQVEGGYTETPVFFTADERAQIAALAAADQDPASRVRLAAMISSGFGDNAQQALTNLGADTVFAHMAGLVASNGNPNSAEMAFRGQQAIEAGSVILPTPTEAKAIIRSTLAPQFRGVAGADAIVENLMDVSTAIYADMAREEADFDANLFNQALNLALGQSSTASNTPTGGMAEINGQATILPVGMAANDVQNALIFVESQFRRQRSGDESAVPTELMTAAGMSGEAPTFGGEPINAEIMDELTMQAVGDGEYLLFYKGHEITAGDTGQSFIIDIRRLINLADYAGNTSFEVNRQ